MDEVVISYETLFEMLRIERSRTELQDLPDDYIEEVKRIIDSQVSELNQLNDFEEKKKKEIHLRNMLKIVNELYERREKKILNMALDKSKTKSAIIDFSRFLDNEKELFYAIMEVLDRYRQSLTEEVLSKGEVKCEFEGNESEKRGIEGDEKMPESGSCIIGGIHGEQVSNMAAAEEPPLDEDSFVIKSGKMRSVRFLSPIPRFLGPELEEYGPFDDEEISSLPSKVVDILIQKKRAEEIIIDD